MTTKEELIKCIEENYVSKHHCDICGKVSKYSPLRIKLLDLVCNCNTNWAFLTMIKSRINDKQKLKDLVEDNTLKQFKDALIDLVNEDCWSKEDLLELVEVLIKKDKTTTK